MRKSGMKVISHINAAIQSGAFTEPFKNSCTPVKTENGPCESHSASSVIPTNNRSSTPLRVASHSECLRDHQNTAPTANNVTNPR